MERQYATRITELFGSVRDSLFWQDLLRNLKTWDDEFYASVEESLLHSNDLPILNEKSFRSAMEKAFRKDCLHNSKWPDPANGSAFLEPHTHHTGLNDLVRTTITVRFLDGAEFLAKRIEQLASQHGLRCEIERKADPSGYYAIHLSVFLAADVTTSSWARETITFQFEIQIPTVTQSSFRAVSHRLYERARIAPPDENSQWQWAPESLPFQTQYLGHILHYVDGMLVETRKSLSK